MKLTDEDIREFADIWEREFHERLSSEDARRQASLFLDLYAELYLSPEAKDQTMQNP